VGEGIGEGDAVAEDGSTWHTVFVAAAAHAMVPRGMNEAAWALPGMPRVRKLPLSRVTAATRTFAKRIRIACPALRQVSRVLFVNSEAFRGWMGMYSHIRDKGYICLTRTPDLGPPGRAGRRIRWPGLIDATVHRCDGLQGQIGSVIFVPARTCACTGRRQDARSGARKPNRRPPGAKS
jgi:hypothetical protein